MEIDLNNEEELIIKYWKTDDLIDSEYNPREISKKQFGELCDSIKRFGFKDPIIVNTNEERRGVLIAGHQRRKACLELGVKKIPTIEVNLSLDRERELNVRHNKNGGKFDVDLLSNFFEIDELKEWGFEAWELGLEEYDFGQDGEGEENPFEPKLYEPSNIKPEVLEMVDLVKFSELIKEIEEREDLTDDERSILTFGAYRNIIFKFDKVADFYANSEKEIQELFERSGLVLFEAKKNKGNYPKVINEKHKK